MSYQIITLGSFNVIKDNHSLLKSSVNSKKVWELYKFMLTHKNQSFTAEMLTDQLWSEEDYSDSSATIRRQMHRLRILLQEEASSDNQSILLTNGFYHWNNNLNVSIDSKEFVDLLTRADEEMNTNPVKALSLYLKAIDTYSGDYLSESYNEHWVFPTRNHLRQLFLKSISIANTLLKQNHQYKEIISLCEKAIHIDYYEEAFHLQLIESYIELGNSSMALEHLEKVAVFLKKELGIELSHELLNLKKKLVQQQKINKPSIDHLIDDNKNIAEAFFCDREIFKSIFELECRRSERSNLPFSIYSLYIQLKKESSLSKKELYNKKIVQQLRSSFRKGDVFTQWEEDTYYLLLSGTNDDVARTIIERVFSSDIERKQLSIEVYTKRFESGETRTSSLEVAHGH